MELLLSHWHCIIPAAALIIAVVFMNREKPKKKSAAGNREKDIDQREESEG
jgi:hypothetical protein